MYDDCLRRAYSRLVVEGWSASEIADRVLDIDLHFIVDYLSERDPKFRERFEKNHHDELLKLAEVECDE